ncbi:MAG TPA: DinB family protein [Thermomicrobiales bacterium]|nr:DinB family protein [Thermomicrobiales bacterium]
MLAEAIRNSYAYNEWATEKIFDAAEGMTVEQLDAPGPIPHGSIRGTLLHMLTAHQRFLSWWDGSMTAQESYSRRMNPDDYPDLAAVRALWQQVAEQARAFVGDLSDEDATHYLSMTRPDGAEFGFPLWQMMQHIANHATQHCSEIAAMLTEAGRSPGDIDMLFYQIEANARA